MTEKSDLLASALAGRYTLERELGRGGMATVYLATDLKHQRQVALKVLRPELAAVLGGQRFLREITFTAGLHHPHILPLLDSGTFTAPIDSAALPPDRPAPVQHHALRAGRIVPRPPEAREAAPGRGGAPAHPRGGRCALLRPTASASTTGARSGGIPQAPAMPPR